MNNKDQESFISIELSILIATIFVIVIAYAAAK